MQGKESAVVKKESAVAKKKRGRWVDAWVEIDRCMDGAVVKELAVCG